MDEQVKHALQNGDVIDITTKGRKSGQSRRIEIRFHNIDGTLYITGTPTRPRNWYANLHANPEFTFHLKRATQADLRARATPIVDAAARRRIIAAIHSKTGRREDLDAWVTRSPLVSVQILEQ